MTPTQLALLDTEEDIDLIKKFLIWKSEKQKRIFTYIEAIAVSRTALLILPLFILLISTGLCLLVFNFETLPLTNIQYYNLFKLLMLAASEFFILSFTWAYEKVNHYNVSWKLLTTTASMEEVINVDQSALKLSKTILFILIAFRAVTIYSVVTSQWVFTQSSLGMFTCGILDYSTLVDFQVNTGILETELNYALSYGMGLPLVDGFLAGYTGFPNYNPNTNFSFVNDESPLVAIFADCAYELTPYIGLPPMKIGTGYSIVNATLFSKGYNFQVDVHMPVAGLAPNVYNFTTEWVSQRCIINNYLGKGAWEFQFQIDEWVVQSGGEAVSLKIPGVDQIRRGNTLQFSVDPYIKYLRSVSESATNYNFSTNSSEGSLLLTALYNSLYTTFNDTWYSPTTSVVYSNLAGRGIYNGYYSPNITYRGLSFAAANIYHQVFQQDQEFIASNCSFNGYSGSGSIKVNSLGIILVDIIVGTLVFVQLMLIIYHGYVHKMKTKEKQCFQIVSASMRNELAFMSYISTWLDSNHQNSTLEILNHDINKLKTTELRFGYHISDKQCDNNNDDDDNYKIKLCIGSKKLIENVSGDAEEEPDILKILGKQLMLLRKKWNDFIESIIVSRLGLLTIPLIILLLSSAVCLTIFNLETIPLPSIKYYNIMKLIMLATTELFIWSYFHAEEKLNHYVLSWRLVKQSTTLKDILKVTQPKLKLSKTSLVLLTFRIVSIYAIITSQYSFIESYLGEFLCGVLDYTHLINYKVKTGKISYKVKTGTINSDLDYAIAYGMGFPLQDGFLAGYNAFPLFYPTQNFSYISERSPLAAIRADCSYDLVPYTGPTPNITLGTGYTVLDAMKFGKSFNMKVDIHMPAAGFDPHTYKFNSSWVTQRCTLYSYLGFGAWEVQFSLDEWGTVSGGSAVSLTLPAFPQLRRGNTLQYSVDPFIKYMRSIENTILDYDFKNSTSEGSLLLTGLYEGVITTLNGTWYAPSTGVVFSNMAQWGTLHNGYYQPQLTFRGLCLATAAIFHQVFQQDLLLVATNCTNYGFSGSGRITIGNITLIIMDVLIGLLVSIHILTLTFYVYFQRLKPYQYPSFKSTSISVRNEFVLMANISLWLNSSKINSKHVFDRDEYKIKNTELRFGEPVIRNDIQTGRLWIGPKASTRVPKGKENVQKLQESGLVFEKNYGNNIKNPKSIPNNKVRNRRVFEWAKDIYDNEESILIETMLNENKMNGILMDKKVTTVDYHSNPHIDIVLDSQPDEPEPKSKSMTSLHRMAGKLESESQLSLDQEPDNDMSKNIEISFNQQWSHQAQDHTPRVLESNIKFHPNTKGGNDSYEIFANDKNKDMIHGKIKQRTENNENLPNTPSRYNEFNQSITSSITSSIGNTSIKSSQGKQRRRSSVGRMAQNLANSQDKRDGQMNTSTSQAKEVNVVYCNEPNVLTTIPSGLQVSTNDSRMPQPRRPSFSGVMDSIFIPKTE